MFSKDSARQADACRFCWMCRHICPVAGATGSEAWTPRARGLMISMIERGTEFDKDIAEAMYHCTLCDACANDCVTGYKPSEYTREARMRAVVEDLAPAAVIKMIDTISECGNIFGLSAMGKLLKSRQAAREGRGTSVHRSDSRGNARRHRRSCHKHSQKGRH